MAVKRGAKRARRAAHSVARARRGTICFTAMSSPNVRPFRPSRVVERRASRPAVLGALAAAIAVAACHDTTGIAGQYATVATSFTVYPFRSAVPPYGSALNLYTQAVVEPGLTTYATTSATTIVPNFDLAFNVDSTGHIVLVPPKLVVSALTPLRTGFQTSSTVFESLGSAPGGTYQADSAFRVTVGQTIIVQAQGISCTVGTPFYAKMIIDSVNALSGAMYVRATVDQNCGYKSFAAGLPTS